MKNKNKRKISALWFLTVVIMVFFPVALAAERIRMATTTSTENSGLLHTLLPAFEKKFNVKVDVIAVGTGKALKLGENGDVDLVFVHSKEAEEEFMRKGFGVERRGVMYNDLVILGPPADPAGIRASGNVVEVFEKLIQEETPFVSRGDDSGTHKKEKELWKAAGIEPEGSWYVETGQGMGATLMIAGEKRAYCLADRGTFLAFQNKIDLAVLFAGDSRLHNPYSMIAVNPARHPHTNYARALTLINWITSPEGKRIIAGYRKNGRILFRPLTR